MFNDNVSSKRVYQYRYRIIKKNQTEIEMDLKSIITEMKKFTSRIQLQICDDTKKN